MVWSVTTHGCNLEQTPYFTLIKTTSLNYKKSSLHQIDFVSDITDKSKITKKNLCIKSKKLLDNILMRFLIFLRRNTFTLFFFNFSRKRKG